MINWLAKRRFNNIDWLTACATFIAFDVGGWLAAVVVMAIGLTLSVLAERKAGVQ